MLERIKTDYERSGRNVAACMTVTKINWLIAEIERLRAVMKTGCKMVEVCGHTDNCRCCWCALRKLMAETHDSQSERSGQ